MGLRVLFVEDHGDTRNILSQLLRHFGYQVQVAADCQTARSLLEESNFDVLLSDIGLPDGDGCNLVAEAKQKQPLVGIALTAFAAESNNLERAKEGGFDHYLTKPVDVHRLRSVLEAIVT